MLIVSTGALPHVVRCSPPVLSTCEVADAGARLGEHLEAVPAARTDERPRSSVVRRLAAAGLGLAAASAGVLALGSDALVRLGGLR